MSFIIALIRLARLPNIFTAMSNVWAGSFIAGHGLIEWRIVSIASVASAFLYAGGVMLNDYCDRDRDRASRPGRPIPAGLIKPHRALIISLIFLAVGSGVGFLISVYAGVICLSIAISAILYDTLKAFFPPAIIFMGLCRGLNWMLGLITAGAIDKRLLLLPLGIFLYIASLTAISRWEEIIPPMKRWVRTGIIAIPLIDGGIVLAFGYVWPGIAIAALIIPTVIVAKTVEMT